MISDPAGSPTHTHRLQLRIEGAVQGVGFRPFVYHLATSLGLTGWIRNTPQGVLIQVEGTISHLQAFQTRLQSEKPIHAHLHKVEVIEVGAVGDPDFAILVSDESSAVQPTSALILPDLATCSACLADIFNPANRHYRYPFTNCTHCGPRFSIVRSLPYDRANTTLQGFPLCPDCQAEYCHSPRSPFPCPTQCLPSLWSPSRTMGWFWSGDGGCG